MSKTAKFISDHKLLFHITVVIIILSLTTAVHLAQNTKNDTIEDSSTVHILNTAPKPAELPPENNISGIDKLNYINEHSESFPDRLAEMANSNSETIDFVYNYPFREENEKIDLSSEAESGTVPLLLQWDERWGYEEYCGDFFACTGCGPTCLSMVALHLTGNAEYTPLAVAEYSQRNGYAEGKSGTSWALMSEGCAHFGLSSQELPLDEERMASALSSGKPLILIMGRGDFTENGHFIVLTGYEDGAFTVNDPNSIARSGRKWTYDEISSQIRNIWAFSAGDGGKDKPDIQVFYVGE